MNNWLFFCKEGSTSIFYELYDNQKACGFLALEVTGSEPACFSGPRWGTCEDTDPVLLGRQGLDFQAQPVLVMLTVRCLGAWAFPYHLRGEISAHRVGLSQTT